MAHSTLETRDGFKRIESIIQSNNTIKKSTVTLVKEFLEVQENFLHEVDQFYKCLDTVEHVADIFLDETKKTALKEFNPLEQVQLAVCGYNSVGKTSFIHELLGCGDFLPMGTGAVSARVVKFSYAPAEKACLIRYASVQDLTKLDSQIDLSDHFKDGTSIKARSKGLRKLVKEHVGRPEDMDPKSDEFAQWAKLFVEIRLPSENLRPGLHVYDTPGFLGSDPPILRENLLALVGSVRPTLVFLYDNPTGSDDSRKCYNELKLALRSEQLGADIFFLNTKADVAIIRRDASNNDDDEDEDDEKLIYKERSRRYELLMNIKEMKGDVHERNLDETIPSVDQCASFDIFTSASPYDPMEVAIRSHAINRIIFFAAAHDLRFTRYVINIVHEVIDAFFDFILVTNRRSTDEWNRLRDDALKWGRSFFQQYQSAIDTIANEANRRLPEHFQEKRLDIEKEAMVDCKTRTLSMGIGRFLPWDRDFDNPVRAYTHGFTTGKKLLKSAINLTRDYRTDEQNFIDIMVEREVAKPVLLEIIAHETDNIKKEMNNDSRCYRRKNELLYAANREVLTAIGSFGDMNKLSTGQIILKIIRIVCQSPILLCSSISELMVESLCRILFPKDAKRVEERHMDCQEREIRHYLVDVEHALKKMGDQMKSSMKEWINQEHEKFKKKVDGYHKMVCRTIQERQKAYELARSFVPKFARIECHLEANLNWAAHYGSHPVVKHHEKLGTGGFFTVHPASWDDDHGLVAKRLQDKVKDQNVAYLEAHFHRTVTKLDIPHMIPLKYLYVDGNASIYILLPRYQTTLKSFLMENMRNVTTGKAINIARDIASVIAHMHAFDLVHRDIKAENILMDEQEEVYLADFGTCQHGTENRTVVGSFPLSPEIVTQIQLTAASSSSDRQYSYEGTAVDVYLLGILMFVCAPKDVYIEPSINIVEQARELDRKKVPARYCTLMHRCLEKDIQKRPTAQAITDELDDMVEKPCTICEDAPRTVRFQPCGHKVVCNECLARLRRTKISPLCIVCNQPFTSVQEDNNTNTFFIASSNQ